MMRLVGIAWASEDQGLARIGILGRSNSASDPKRLGIQLVCRKQRR